MFPQKTYEKMLNIINSYRTNDYDLNNLHRKFKEINDLDNIDKKNRWFGYYQCKGEDLGLWTLKEIKDWVRNEKNRG